MSAFYFFLLFYFAVQWCVFGLYKILIPNSYPKPGIINCQYTHVSHCFTVMIITVTNKHFLLTQRAVTAIIWPLREKYRGCQQENIVNFSIVSCVKMTVAAGCIV